MRITFLPLFYMASLLAFIIPAQSPSHLHADEFTGQEIALHKSEVTGLAITLDGTKLISTSLRDDRVSTIRMGKEPSIADDGGVITGARSHAVAISPGGTRVAIAGFRSTSMYNLDLSRELWRIDILPDEYSPPYVMALAFSPDGERLATSGSSSKVGGRHGYKGGLITIRDTASGREIHRYDDLSHPSDSTAFSPDGKLFAAGTLGAGGELPEPGELRIWDAKNGALLQVWKVKDAVQAGEDHYAIAGIAFSPESQTIALAVSDGTVRLWDVTTKKVVSELKGHKKGVRRVAFRPDGSVFATAGSDRTVRLWNVKSGQQEELFKVTSTKINALIFSPDGKLLVAGGGNFLRTSEVRMWSLNAPDRK